MRYMKIRIRCRIVTRTAYILIVYFNNTVSGVKHKLGSTLRCHAERYDTFD